MNVVDVDRIFLLAAKKNNIKHIYVNCISIGIKPQKLYKFA